MGIKKIVVGICLMSAAGLLTRCDKAPSDAPAENVSAKTPAAAAETAAPVSPDEEPDDEFVEFMSYEVLLDFRDPAKSPREQSAVIDEIAGKKVKVFGLIPAADIFDGKRTVFVTVLSQQDTAEALPAAVRVRLEIDPENLREFVADLEKRGEHTRADTIRVGASGRLGIEKDERGFVLVLAHAAINEE